MFEKIKNHLLFIKDIIIDTVAYWATFGVVYVYTRFALVPEINADIQLAILLLISFVIYWVYKKRFRTPNTCTFKDNIPIYVAFAFPSLHSVVSA